MTITTDDESTDPSPPHKISFESDFHTEQVWHTCSNENFSVTDKRPDDFRCIGILIVLNFIGCT